MPSLVSGRRLVTSPDQLLDSRYQFLDLASAQPALGLTPSSGTGFTLVVEASGKITYSNTLGNLSFNSGTISTTLANQNITLATTGTATSVVITNTNESTGTTNGSLVVLGGVGVDKNLNVGGDLQVDNNLNVGGQVTLSPAGSDVYIQPTINGTVVIGPAAYGSIDNMIIGGTTPKIGYFTDLVVESTATSTTATQGALTVAGGAGIVGDLYVGGNIYGKFASTATVEFGNPWQIIETNYTAVNRDRLLINTTATAVTVLLPANPSFGDFVEFIDYAGSFDVNTATIARNGQLIMGIPEDMEIDFAGAANSLIFSGPDEGWRLGAVI